MSNNEVTKGVKIGGVTPSGKEDDTKDRIEEKEFSADENKSQIRAFEDDIISGLLAAADYAKDESRKIEIVREVDGVKKVFFTFHIRPLSPEEIERCRKRSTKYVKNKNLGIKMPEDTDTVKYRNLLIYTATTEEDKERLWDNKRVWESFSKKGEEIVTGSEVVGLTLKAGEMAKIVDVIDEINGVESNIEEVTKN